MAVRTRASGTRSGLQWASLASGALFLAAGVLGFTPGSTHNHQGITLAGPESPAHLLGIFQVSVVHNLLHAVFGAAGLPASRTHSRSRGFFIYGGVAYLALWLYGLLAGDGAPLNFLPTNGADDLLHLALGLAMISLAVLLSPRTPHVTPPEHHEGAL